MQQHPDYSAAQLKQQLTNLVKTTLEQDLDFEEGQGLGLSSTEEDDHLPPRRGWRA